MRIVKQEPAARRTSRNFTFGVLFTLEKEVVSPTGERTVVQTQVFTPSLIRPRDRSKYMPHQGRQERYRRMNGGWARHRRMGEFYGLYHPSDGAPHTKRSVFP